MDAWNKFLTFAVYKYPESTFHGIIHKISKNTPEMIVANDTRYINVHLSVQERIPFVSEVVEHCTAFKIGVDVDENKQKITRYAIYVHPTEFERQISQCIKGEIYIAQLLKEIWSQSVTTMTIVKPPKAKQGVKCLKEWNYKLLPHQVRSIDWMKEHEKKIIAQIPLEFNQGIKVLSTDWFFDYNFSTFALNVDRGIALVRGGILSDGTGMGKTASMLRLILDTRQTSFESHIHTHYESRATLIIVPINLPSQWLSEIEKFIGQTLKVVSFYTGTHVKERTMQDLLLADIVLTTFAFIRGSKPYHDMIEANICSTMGCAEDKKLHLSFPAVRAWARSDTRTAPILHAVRWKRIIIDEIHEFVDQKDFKIIIALQTHIIWGMTATPDIFSERANNLHFILQGAHAQHPDLTQSIVTNCIKGTSATSTFDNKVMRVDAGENVRERMEGLTMEQVVKFGMTIVDKYCDEGVSLCSETHINTRLTTDVMQTNASQLFCKSHTCSICLDEICSTITNCGHVYCHRCITRHLQENNNACPMCRTLLMKNGIVSVIKDKVATKLEVLADMIVNLDSPAIVFAQYRTMLRSLREMLHNTRLRVICLEGNMHRRIRLLDLFKTDGGILLICMQDSYAGLHLPCAEHIIFSHALLGDKQTVTDMEEQAIARAVRPGQKHTVKVHSFVIADSPEEDLWLSTH